MTTLLILAFILVFVAGFATGLILGDKMFTKRIDALYNEQKKITKHLNHE